MTKTSRTLVVGGGLSGLACAFDLARSQRDVLLLEAEGRVGGVVGTVEDHGFRFETGPTTVPAASRDFRALCNDVGLASRFVASRSAANERYLLHEGKLETVPSSPIEILTWSALSIGARMRLGGESVRRFDPAQYASEPDLETVLSERIGPEATRLLAGAFVRGVFAAELSELGAKSAFPRLWALAAEHGGLIRGIRAMREQPRAPLPGPAFDPQTLLTFPNGMRELPDAIARELGPRVRLCAAVVRIERASSAARWVVVTASGETLEADTIVLATSASVAAHLLATVAPADFPLVHLRDVAHSDVTLVMLGFDSRELPGFPRGFGYLVPPSESPRPRGLGTLFPSNIFPDRAPEGHASTATFFREHDVAGVSDEGLVELAAAELGSALHLARPPRPLVTHVRRWKDVLPKYAPGHRDRMDQVLAAVHRELPGIHLAGNCFGGISVDHVIARGRAVAMEIHGAS